MFKRLRDSLSPPEVRQKEKYPRVTSPSGQIHTLSLKSSTTCQSTEVKTMSNPEFMEATSEKNNMSSPSRSSKAQLSDVPSQASISASSTNSDIPTEFKTVWPDWARELTQFLLKAQADQTETLKKELHQVTKSLEFTEAKTKEALEKSQKNEIKINHLESVCDSVQKENSELKERLIQLEAQSRRSNLRIYGRQYEKKANLRAWFKTFMQEKLQMSKTRADCIEIERIHWSGNKQYVLMKFLRFTERMEVWDCRKKLAGSGFSMSEDFPWEIERRRSRLIPVLRAAYDNDMEANLVLDRLYINSNKYTVDNLDQLPDQLKPENICQKKEGNVTFFFGKDTALSNFYESHFDLDGNHFSSSEQFIQYSKAMLFKDSHCAAKIMAAASPEQQKALGRKVANFDKDQWAMAAGDLIIRGLAQKFEQNLEARAALIKTGVTTLAECSARDTLFGIGLSLRDPDRCNQSKWKGKNLLGKMLTQVRDSYK